MTAYLRMERIDPSEEAGFYIPGAWEWDEQHKANALRTRERRRNEPIDPLPYVEGDEWN